MKEKGETNMPKPILCLDFDGVLHSYESGWKGADIIPDPPVPGVAKFLRKAAEVFEIHIFSSRSSQEGGIAAMKVYICNVISPPDQDMSTTDWALFQSIQWPTVKPPAFVTIDDRAIQFTGVFPSIADLQSFRPWNKARTSA